MRAQGRSWLWAAAAALLIAGPLVGLPGATGLARADEGLRLKTLDVSVWPEYDEPRVAVMYEGEFAGADFPQKVRFYLPKGAEVSEVCALKKPDDEHLCQLYDVGQEGDQVTVTYTLPIPTFFVQFYYGSLGGTTQRNVDFALKAPYAVESLALDVQQPLRSESFSVTPPAPPSGPDSQGFKFFHLGYQSVPAGQVTTIRASYTKADANPSVAKRQTGTTEGTSAGSTAVTYTPVAVLGIGVLVIAAILLIGRRRPAEPAPERLPTSPGPVPAATRPVGTSRLGRSRSGKFCTSCGAALEPEDGFCPKCGRQARRAATPTGGRR